MKTFIVCFSYHHKNTEKIASVFAKTLDAEVKMPGEVSPQGFSEYDLVGFGSGISFGKHYKVLIDFADKLPPVTKKKAFIFSTSGQTAKHQNSIRNFENCFNQKASILLESLTVQDLTLMAFSK